MRAESCTSTFVQAESGGRVMYIVHSCRNRVGKAGSCTYVQYVGTNGTSRGKDLVQIHPSVAGA